MRLPSAQKALNTFPRPKILQLSRYWGRCRPNKGPFAFHDMCFKFTAKALHFFFQKSWNSLKFFHFMLCFVFASKQSQLILPRLYQIWLFYFMKIRPKRKFRLFWKTNFTNVLKSSGKNARSILDPLNEV